MNRHLSPRPALLMIVGTENRHGRAFTHARKWQPSGTSIGGQLQLRAYVMAD